VHVGEDALLGVAATDRRPHRLDDRDLPGSVAHSLIVYRPAGIFTLVLISDSVALVTGGASGLGAGTAQALAEAGARVAVLDRDGERAAAVARDADGLPLQADVTDEAAVAAALAKLRAELGIPRLLVCCHGVLTAQRTVGRRGPAELDAFARTVSVNLVGTFNVLRLTAAAMAEAEPDGDGERGVAVLTASIAAYEGQIGQAAYAASKAGVVGMTLPAARDLADYGIRVVSIAPGIFDTPMLASLPEEARQSLAAGVPFPRRLGRADDFARLVCEIAENPLLNGTTLRLDGALRLAPT
jgi:NAD(P)-dependent dehydrogenase (short-subunit alcohol dehydrogenase family)